MLLVLQSRRHNLKLGAAMSCSGNGAMDSSDMYAAYRYGSDVIPSVVMQVV